MAVKERELPGGKWERTFTGEDIPKARGSLEKTAKEAYRKAFHRDEGIGFEKVTNPQGEVTWLRKDQVEDALADGYGRVGTAIAMVVPDLPWSQKHVGPGRHRFKYDKASRQMVEA